MIYITCIILAIFLIIKYRNNNFNIPYTKIYTFEIHKSEKGVHKLNDKVNAWVKPESTEIRFYATNFNNSDFRTIGTIYNKNIHKYITQNPKNKKASIIYVDANTVKIKLELF